MTSWPSWRAGFQVADPWALWTGHLLVVEVDGELVAGVRAALTGVPGGIAAHRADQPDLILGPQREQTLGGRVAGVHQMLTREQAPAGEHRVDRHRHRRVGHGGVRGYDVGDQVRRQGGVGGVVTGGGVVAGLGDVDFVAFPAGAAFLAVAGVDVVRRDDPGSARREPMLFGVPPDHRPPGLAERVLLDPHLSQHVDGGYLPQPRRCPTVSDHLQ
jgi:hypothetical protein